MKQIFNILFVLLLCLPSIVIAQSEECGTDFTPEMEARLLQNIAKSKQMDLSSSSRTTTYVGVNFHLVGNNDGSSRGTKNSALDALCGLNQRYADQDIQFYLKGFFELNSTVVNSHSNPQTAQFQMSLRKVANNNAINIFVCNSIQTTNNTIGTTLAYYTSQYDLIAIRASQMNSTGTTLTHEMGHLFSLPHPFRGWEGVDYHCNLATYTSSNPCPNPTYSASNLPPTSMNGVIVELADGSNCTTAGDLFCDTDPDYNLGFLGGNNCNYTSGAVDPNGQAINPNETLYMGYFNDNCTDKFTNDQKGAIAADLSSPGRFYMKGTPATTTVVSTTATLVSPQDNATSPFYDEVYLNWDDVPGANQYIVQVNRSPTFTASLMEEEVLVTNSSYAVQNLSANTNYYWRVRAFNEVSTCNSFSANRKFRTSNFTVNTKEAFGTTKIKLQPNFASEGQIVNLSIQAERKIDATIRIVNMAGQNVQDVQNVTFQAGTHIHEIETSSLAPGVYIVNLQTAQGQSNERLVITD